MDRRTFIKGALAGTVYSIIPISIPSMTKNIEFVEEVQGGAHYSILQLHAFLSDEWEVVYEGIV